MRGFDSLLSLMKAKKKKDTYRHEVSYVLPAVHSVGIVRDTKKQQATIFIETLKSSDPNGKELDRFMKQLLHIKG